MLLIFFRICSLFFSVALWHFGTFVLSTPCADLTLMLRHSLLVSYLYCSLVLFSVTCSFFQLHFLLLRFHLAVTICDFKFDKFC